MNELKLKWHLGGGKQSQDRRWANCGMFTIEVDFDEDAAWHYTIECQCSTIREFGDYTKSWGTRKAAQLAAEKWMLGLVKTMSWALKA